MICTKSHSIFSFQITERLTIPGYGLLSSILTLICVISYASYQLNSLVARDQYRLQLASEEDYYLYNKTFDDEFKVAAAITDWDGIPYPIEDPTIGELKFLLVEWDTYQIYKSNFTWLELKICDESDFHSNRAK